MSKRIMAIHEASKETDGAPRVPAEPADGGVFVDRKRTLILPQTVGNFQIDNGRWKIARNTLLCGRSIKCLSV